MGRYVGAQWKRRGRRSKKKEKEKEMGFAVEEGNNTNENVIRGWSIVDAASFWRAPRTGFYFISGPPWGTLL